MVGATRSGGSFSDAPEVAHPVFPAYHGRPAYPAYPAYHDACPVWEPEAAPVWDGGAPDHDDGGGAVQAPAAVAAVEPV